MDTNRIVSIYYHNTQGAKASTYTNAVTTCLVYLGSVTADGIVSILMTEEPRLVSKQH
jgi:hypothetical protein